MQRHVLIASLQSRRIKKKVALSLLAFGIEKRFFCGPFVVFVDSAIAIRRGTTSKTLLIAAISANLIGTVTVQTTEHSLHPPGRAQYVFLFLHLKLAGLRHHTHRKRQTQRAPGNEQSCKQTHFALCLSFLASFCF